MTGKVADYGTGENIAGANIYQVNSSSGTVSNAYGYYSLSIETERDIEISCSFIGYSNEVLTLHLTKDTVINIFLKRDTLELNEVNVSAYAKKNIQSSEMSLQRLSIREIKRIPAFVGEADIIRSLQYLPGVNVGNEGVNNISIRGGSFDQNLVLLDEAVLYNPNHALSFFSTFNPDAISFVDFYKSAFPAKYGGRLSSVIDVRMREGNNQKYNVSGGIGLISSRLSIEGPIKKGKSSFIVSGRYSYAGFLANQLYALHSTVPSLNNYRKGNEVNFYDLNLKFNFEFGKKDHLFISGYTGHDHFYFKNFSDNYSLDWGNISSTIRWNHIFGSKMFSNTTFVYSNYSYEYYLKADVRDFLWQARMQNLQFKSDFEHYLNNFLKIKLGYFSGFLFTLPGKIVPSGPTSVIRPFSLNQRKSAELGAYIETDTKLGSFLVIRTGLRFTSFSEIGPATIYKYTSDGTLITDSTSYSRNEIIKTYNKFEPRLLLNFILSQNASVKVSYSKTHQFLHLLTNSSIGLPTDIWLPSGENLSPQMSNQYGLGFFRNFSEDRVESSVEIYYKKMDNIIDFRNNADLFLNSHLESQILSGYADSYGTEFFINKKYGTMKGWVSYTISKSTNHIKGVNNNDPYSPVYDKRHNLKILLFYDLGERWTFSSSFAFSSGSNITVPVGFFQYYGSSFNYYTQRNGYKLPSFHQLDISLTLRSLIKRRWKSEWVFSLNNIYNRKNVFSVYVRQYKFDLTEAKAYKLYLYGIFPSVTYNFKF